MNKSKSGYLRGFLPTATPGVLATGLSALGASASALATGSIVTAGVLIGTAALGALGVLAGIAGAPVRSARSLWSSYFSSLKDIMADIAMGSPKKELSWQRKHSLAKVCKGACAGVGLSAAMGSAIALDKVPSFTEEPSSAMTKEFTHRALGAQPLPSMQAGYILNQEKRPSVQPQ